MPRQSATVMQTQSASPVESDRPDDRVQALVERLEWPVDQSGAWGVILSVVMGLLTLGLWPLVSWQARFRELATQESEDWRELAGWLRRRSSASAARRLELLSRRMTYRSGFTGLGLAALGVVALMFVAAFVDHRLSRFDLAMEGLIDATWRQGEVGRDHLPATLLPRLRLDPSEPRLGPARARNLFVMWTLGLSVAYGLHWLQVRRHVSSMRRYVKCLDQVLAHEQVDPLALWSGGQRVRWFLGAVAMVLMQFYWGVALALAGAAQRNYIQRVSQPTRQQVAQRLRELMARPPVIDAPGFSPEAEVCVCPNQRCRKRMAVTAKFCSRCGSRMHPEVDQVA